MKRPEGITTIAIWYFICAGFSVLGLMGVAIGLVGVWTEGNLEDILFGTLGMMIAEVALAGIGVLCAVVGWGLIKLKPWAISGAKILAAISLIVVPFGTIAGIMILVYLSRNEEAKKAFNPGSEPG